MHYFVHMYAEKNYLADDFDNCFMIDARTT